MKVVTEHLLDVNMECIVALCVKYNVKKLYLFGSALRNDFGSDSDIDLAVIFARSGIAGSFDQYFGFKTELEKLFGRPVDIVCMASIRNRVFRKEIEETKKLLYAA
jgi:uncharacterized protein